MGEEVCIERKDEMKKYIKEGRTEGNEEIKEEIRNGKGKMYRN